jgi:hypothetical protein
MDTPTNTPTPTTGQYKISGFISPDFSFAESAKAVLNAGFKIEIVGTSFSTITDSNGFFKLNDIPESSAGYTIKISKPNYLYREIKNIIVNGNVQLGSAGSPILMWAGDLVNKGVQDNAINMLDMRLLSDVFNTSVGNSKYVYDYDLNKDGAINMIDVRLLAEHFNRIPESYNK